MTPRGFRDVLFDEAREREAVTGAISAFFASWGYEPVETPAVEEYATLEAGTVGDLESTAFRLFDLDGSLLALRPEMTVPIARLSASRLAGAPAPHRIRYSSDVFREHASLRGQSRQFRQLGIELVGAHGAAADTEVVLLLIGALEAAGLESFVVGVGTAEVLRALLERAGGPAEWRAAMIAAIQGRNLVEIDRLSGREDLDPMLSTAFREIPRLRGGNEALLRCRELAEGCGCASALETITTVWSALSALDRTARAQLDFGIMRSFGYYTGLQVEAYAPGLGLGLAGGGRYDGLLSAFGHPAPAAGFAIGLERLMIALAEQGTSPRLEPLDAVLGGEDFVAVLASAARLRSAGWRVRVAPERDGQAVVREADLRGAAEALYVEEGVIVRLDRSGEIATPLGEPIPEAPRHTWAAHGGEVL